MANFIVSYTLKGLNRDHAEMDKHIAALGKAFVVARLFETTWYIAGPTSCELLKNYLRSKLRKTDPVGVFEPIRASWANLPIDDAAFKACFENQPVAA